MTFFGNTYRALQLLPWAVAAAGALLLGLAMPGVNFAEGAWFWAVPFLLWATTKPAWRKWALFSFGAMWAVKIATLVWLRHVYPPLGWLGLVLLTAYLALFPVLWLGLVRWLFPKTFGAGVVARIVVQLGLAGAWVALEWVQSWLLSGFPWGLLAETQWLRPPVLALGQLGGPWAVGFVIILFNIGVARYVLRFAEDRERAEQERWRAARDGAGTPETAGRAALAKPGLADGPLSLFRRMCPEFYVGMIPVFASFYIYIETGRYLAERSETLFTASVVQTDFDPNAKWDAERFSENVAALSRLTRAALRLSPKDPVFEMPADPAALLPVEVGEAPAAPPDLLLWPEAALPLPVHSEGYAPYVRDLLKGTPTTLVAGGITSKDAPPPATPEGLPGYYNMIFTATAADGPSSAFYAKRHLVPFGEYVPAFASAIGLRRVVPLKMDCLVGTRDKPLPVRIGGGNRAKGRLLHAGTLVCYEDVFPDLALQFARGEQGANTTATRAEGIRIHLGPARASDDAPAAAATRGVDFLCVLTNDAWYGREAGAYQHAAHSAVMASALRLPVIRCGNNGWSGVFTPSGHALPLRNADGSIYFRGAGRFEVRGVPAALRQPTFYEQNGNWLVTCSFLLLLWASLRHIPFRRGPNKERSRKL